MKRIDQVVCALACWTMLVVGISLAATEKQAKTRIAASLLAGVSLPGAILFPIAAVRSKGNPDD